MIEQTDFDFGKQTIHHSEEQSRWQEMAIMQAISLAEYQFSVQGRLVSYCRPVTGITPADFLHQAEGRERFYWRDGRRGITLTGMGIAVDLMAWGETRFTGIQRQARELFDNGVVLNRQEPLAAPRLFGGFAFRQDFTPDNTWAAFNPAHFILPHYQLVVDGENSWLTINTLLSPDEDPQAELPQLQEALDACYEMLRQAATEKGNKENVGKESTSKKNADCEINYPMSYTRWERIIQDAIHQFQTTSLDKAVLSRVCEVKLADRVNLNAILAYLNRQYADCYIFIFEPRPSHAFFGATPELLAEVHGDGLATMSLAGSIQRGATPVEDGQLADELLDSDKDRHEHALVVEAMRRRLAPMTTDLQIPAEPVIYKLSNIQHLYTPIQAKLRGNNGILPLVEILHPTPALGGSPRDLALDFIREAEPVPRGWYAAPVGWIDYTLDGAFGVAIRSAVAQNRRVWLYAGAGIVADSVAQKEWDETGWKFRPILGALGIK